MAASIRADQIRATHFTTREKNMSLSRSQRQQLRSHLWKTARRQSISQQDLSSIPKSYFWRLNAIHTCEYSSILTRRLLRRGIKMQNMRGVSRLLPEPDLEPEQLSLEKYSGTPTQSGQTTPSQTSQTILSSSNTI